MCGVKSTGVSLHGTDASNTSEAEVNLPWYMTSSWSKPAYLLNLLTGLIHCFWFSNSDGRPDWSSGTAQNRSSSSIYRPATLKLLMKTFHKLQEKNSLQPSTLGLEKSADCEPAWVSSTPVLTLMKQRGFLCGSRGVTVSLNHWNPRMHLFESVESRSSLDAH